MSVRLKLVAIILFVAVVPLAVSAVSVLRIHETTFDRTVKDLQRSAAGRSAEVADILIHEASNVAAQVARTVSWGALTAEQRAGAQSLIYQQRDEFAIVQLLDESGKGIDEASLVSERTRGDYPTHPPASVELMEAFSRAIPFDREGDMLFGSAFAPEDRYGPYLPIAVRVPGPHGARWTVAVAVSLSKVCERVSKPRDDKLIVYLVDGEVGGRRTVCGGAGHAGLEEVPPGLAASLPAGDAMIRFTDRDGADVLAAAAPMKRNWVAIAQQPASAATAAGRRMRWQSLFWIAISLIIAVVAGWYLAQGINRPVRALERGARELGSGNLAYRVDVDGGDELAQLATTFNAMSAEIQEWNEELQQRVDDRTRELKEAQKRLLESQKIAAVSSLAAGVAHEINNPLTGVLGFAQVLKSRAAKAGQDKDVAVLGRIEDEGRRIRDIVQTLLSFSQEYSGEGFSQLGVNPVLADSVELVRGQAKERTIEVVTDLQPELPQVRGSAGQLRQVMLHLLNNALTACEPGGRITVDSRLVDGELIRIRVADDGRGISEENLARVFEPFFTTKDDWQGRGLGLTVTYRVVEEHRGTIKIDSTVGEGTTVTILLPVTGGAHLV